MSEEFGTLNQKISNRDISKINFNNQKEEIKKILSELNESKALLFLPVEIKEDLLITFDRIGKEIPKFYSNPDQIGLLNLNLENINEFLNLFEIYISLVGNSEDVVNLKKIKQRVLFSDQFLDDFFNAEELSKDDFIIIKDYLDKAIRAHNIFTTTTLLSFRQYVDSGNDAVKLFINEATKKVDKELKDFRKLRNIADNALTENIYDQAVTKYRDLENDYRWYFYWALGLTVGISLGTFFLKNVLVPNFLGNVEFWVLKASIIVVGVTLITYFLKQSTHYQRLADQNYQTQVELQAYPSFMESIPTEEAASVRKELALKYFGREVDGAAHKDMSNLISDQMKSTTEMVKAATDVLKAKG